MILYQLSIYKDGEFLLGMEYLQPWTKYLRQTLVFLLSSALREKCNFYFHEFFVSIKKFFLF